MSADLRFFLLPIHTKPEHRGNVTVNEINALHKEFHRVAVLFDTVNGVILGDFNCGGEYVGKKQFENLKLVQDQGFHWWIENKTNTTTSGMHSRTYDRCVSKQAGTL